MKFDFTILDFAEKNNSPEKLAIIASDGSLTWQYLCEEVYKTHDQLASYHLPKGHPVIIRGHKEKAFIITILACIMLELPYIPVDIIYPEERLNKIREITKSALTVDCINNKMIFNKENAGNAYYNPQDPLIYIIFTSGSTGDPKGVQISREAIISFLEWVKKDFGFSDHDVFLNQAPFSFDLSVYEIYTFLYLGGTILLTTSEQQKNPELFLQRLQESQCSVWISTPSFAALCLRAPNYNATDIPSLKHFLFCGETLPKRVAKQLLSLFPNSQVLNSYGPTEATVATTLVSITDEIIEKYPTLPVGYVKFSSKIILDQIEIDEEGREIGIIKISGDNVMTGYFANEKANATLLTTQDGKRVFYTGDYGYFKDDLLFFIGRRDNQVKLHGYRIEIDEIDAALHQLTNIHDAVTVPMYRNHEVAKLVAFIILSENTNAANPSLIEQLKSALGEKIPYYMIPADFMFIKKFPYNTNHKICLKSLRELYQNS